MFCLSLSLPKDRCVSSVHILTRIRRANFRGVTSYRSGLLAKIRKGLASFVIYIIKLSDQCQKTLKAELRETTDPVLHRARSAFRSCCATCANFLSVLTGRCIKSLSAQLCAEITGQGQCSSISHAAISLPTLSWPSALRYPTSKPTISMRPSTWAASVSPYLNTAALC